MNIQTNNENNVNETSLQHQEQFNEGFSVNKVLKIASSILIVTIFILTTILTHQESLNNNPALAYEHGLKVRTLIEDSNAFLNPSDLDYDIPYNRTGDIAIQNLFRDMEKTQFQGRWEPTSDYTASNISNYGGWLYFGVQRRPDSHNQTQDDYIMYFKVLEGEFLTQWSLIRVPNLVIHDYKLTNNSLTFAQMAHIETFEEFEFQYTQKGKTLFNLECRLEISLNWANKPNMNNLLIDTTFPGTLNQGEKFTNLNGTINSNCSLSLSFISSTEYLENEVVRVNYYSVFVSMAAISGIIVSIWMIRKVGDSQTNSNCVITN